MGSEFCESRVKSIDIGEVFCSALKKFCHLSDMIYVEGGAKSRSGWKKFSEVTPI